MRPEAGDQARLWDMLQSAHLAMVYASGLTREEYFADALIRDAVERRLEIVGEAARSVSTAFRDAHSEIPWSAIVVQRHVLAHEYEKVLHNRIWEVLTVHLESLVWHLQRLVGPPAVLEDYLAGASAHPGRRLRQLMARGTVMCPGAFNALVARAVARAGFDSVYISGGATANVSGYPDIGLITLTEMCRTIREIADASQLPVVVDADTGYGEVEGVVRTVVEYERAGAAAMHIEDQVFPKRCGHLEGKTLIAASDMADKVSAAAKHRVSKDFIIIARTDARSVTGMKDAIERGNLYRKAGADVIFPEGLESEAEFAEFARGSPGLLLANMTEFGKTPDISAKRFAQLGYQIVIYPLSMLRLAMGHVTRGLESLKEHGSVRETLPEMQSRTDLYDLLNYQPGVQWNFPNPGQGK